VLWTAGITCSPSRIDDHGDQSLVNGEVSCRCLQDYVVVEVKYGDFPAETGWTWTLEESAVTMVADQATGSPSTESHHLQDSVVVEVKYDDFPTESTDSFILTLGNSADTLIADQSTGSFSTEGGAVFNSAYTADGTYTFGMTDTYGDGIYNRYAPANGEPVR
jgi:hypothetical protein